MIYCDSKDEAVMILKALDIASEAAKIQAALEKADIKFNGAAAQRRMEEQGRRAKSFRIMKEHVRVDLSAR